jgi:hypothetical protein
MNYRYLLLYLVVLLHLGYSFGNNDQSEMLPYSLYLHNSSLYQNDFYIQNTANHLPNERYIFSFCLSFFSAYLPYFVFLFHSITSIFLIAGLHRLVRRFVAAEPLQYLSILFVLLAFWGINPGDNELYYHEFIPSYLSQVLALWAIVYYLESRFKNSLVLLIPASLIHPLIGLQVFLFLTAAQIIDYRNHVKDLKKFLSSLLFFLVTGGFWIILIVKQYSDSSVPDGIYVQILQFRLPHHYFPVLFDLKKYLLFIPLISFGLWHYWEKRETKMLLLYLVILLGLFIYTTAIGLGFYQLLGVQWFATAVWLKVFSLLALVACSESKLTVLFNRHLPVSSYFTWMGFFFVIAFVVYKSKNKSMDLPFLTHETEEVHISRLALDKTPNVALFLIPPTLSEFRFFSQRSSYIDWKANVHQKSGWVNWLARIREVYKIDLGDKLKGHDLAAVANQNYSGLDELDLNKILINADSIYHIKITHLIVPKPSILKFPIVAQNSKYVIYKF